MSTHFCNKCFSFGNTKNNIQLNISSCGHILCSECLQPKCPRCSRPFKSTAIDRNMPSSLVPLFENPERLNDQYKKTLKFQLTQEAMLNNYYVNVLPKEIRQTQRETEGMAKLQAQIREKNEILKKRNEKLKAYLAYHEQRQMQPSDIEPPHPRHVRMQRNARVNDWCAPQLLSSDQQQSSKPSTPTLSSENSDNSAGSKSSSSKIDFDFNL